MADFLKSPFLKLGVNDMPESGWTMNSTTWGDENEAQTYYRLVPWLNRAIELRSSGLSSLPFDIIRAGDGEIADSSEDYQNELGWLPDPGALLSALESALCIWNTAYLLNEGAAIPNLRYLYPPSIDPQIDAAAGLTSFIRKVGGKRVPLPVERVVYFWKFDPYVELGPPKHSPTQAVLAACGVLHNMDKFAAAFFARGAIKATILSVPQGTAKEEKDRLRTWWQTVLTGIRNAFSAHILNADAVTPTVIGEGLAELADNELTSREREAIATGMGIPHSILFSGAANFAVAEADDRHFYNKTLVPEGNFIAEVLNQQILQRLGYRLVFAPERLSVFQEDETSRAAALATLVTALKEPESEVGLQILGYDLSEEQWAMLRALWKKSASNPVPPALAPFTGLPQQEIERRAEGEEEEEMPPEMQRELRQWKGKAVARVGQGRQVPFDCHHIPAALAGAIAGALEGAESVDDVKQIFSSVWQGYP